MLTKAGYDGAERILADSVSTLAKNMNISETLARQIRFIVERAVAPAQTSIYDLLDPSSKSVVLGTPGEDDEYSYLPSWGHESGWKQTFVSTGSSSIDDSLNGGFAKGMISELVGESATGKTQFCLYVTVCTALGLPAENQHPKPSSYLRGGKGKSVALITSKGRTAAQHMVSRMVEIAQQLLRLWFEQPSVPDTHVDELVEKGIKLLLGNVFLACTNTFESAEHVLCYILPGLVSRKMFSLSAFELLVLDSVPPLIQEDVHENILSDSPASQHSVRASRLHALACFLKRLAFGAGNAASMAVIVVNHVHDAFLHDAALIRRARACGELPYGCLDHDAMQSVIQHKASLPLAYTPQAAHFSGLLAYVPYAKHYASSSHSIEADINCLKMAQLGLVWTNCINARFLLAHVRCPNKIQLPARRFRVVFSPTCAQPAPPEVLFTITRKGIEVL